MEITFVLMRHFKILKDDGGSKDKDDGNNGSSSRCPNGQHKSPSGDCEKFVPHEGLPRCPDGTHRTPDGTRCEKVSKN